MASSIRCSFCGTSNTAHYTFCIECGKNLTRLDSSLVKRGQLQTDKIDAKVMIHSPSPFTYIPKKGASINYKLLGIGIIIMVIVAVGGIYLFGTFLSNSFNYTIDNDEVKQVLTDSLGNIIVLGGTNSLDFPSTFNDTVSNATDWYPWDQNAFVTKFSPEGNLLWSRIIGGSGIDICNGGTIDIQNNIIVNGYTDSEGFPVTGERSTREYGNTFLMKLAKNGTILWSNTYPSEWYYEYSSGVTTDSQENIIITGSIYGNESYPNAMYNILNPFSENVLIIKLASNGSTIWTYIVGGNGDEFGRSVEVDNTDNIMISGETYSIDFPSIATTSYYNNTEEKSVFILKISPNAEVIWSSLIGGNGTDFQHELLVDNKYIFVAGMTYSPDFPIINASNEEIQGYSKGFIVKYSHDGNLIWSSCFESSNCQRFVLNGNQNIIGIGYDFDEDFEQECSLWIFSSIDSSFSYKIIFGGELGDRGIAIAAYNDNNLLLAGETFSKDFPLVDAHDSTLAGDKDIFVLIYNLDRGIQWGTLLGGSGQEYTWFW
ncbi:MAG: hypothetical protein ACXACU_15740 [Candidatus Hodarchaeales archaeon]|jgi:hypothetical protein